jgi:catechol 2,3-dioxygenase
METDSSVHLGHVHLKVRDVERALEFYQGVLELDVSERVGNYAFLTFGEHHHDVALQGVGENAPGPGRGVGLYHAAFEVDTPARLRKVYERLREGGVTVSPVDHGISKAVYFDDPDGNRLEVYVDTRADAAASWSGTNQRFDPAEL